MRMFGKSSSLFNALLCFSLAERSDFFGCYNYHEWENLSLTLRAEEIQFNIIKCGDPLT